MKKSKKTEQDEILNLILAEENEPETQPEETQPEPEAEAVQEPEAQPEPIEEPEPEVIPQIELTPEPEPEAENEPEPIAQPQQPEPEQIPQPEAPEDTSNPETHYQTGKKKGQRRPKANRKPDTDTNTDTEPEGLKDDKNAREQLFKEPKPEAPKPEVRAAETPKLAETMTIPAAIAVEMVDSTFPPLLKFALSKWNKIFDEIPTSEVQLTKEQKAVIIPMAEKVLGIHLQLPPVTALLVTLTGAYTANFTAAAANMMNNK